MANRRTLKKMIHRTCSDWAVRILIELKPEQARKAVLSLAALQTKTLGDVSFAFDRSRRDFDTPRDYKKALSAYNAKAFATLKHNFREGLDEIVKQINAAVKESAEKKA